MATYEDILSKRSTEVEPPKALPVGTYICVIAGLHEMTKSSRKGTDQLDFKANILQPGDDVDREQLEDAGGFAGKSLLIRNFVTEDAVWRLKEFLVNTLGIDEGDKTLKQMLAEAPGRQFHAHIRHRPSEDGTRIFAEVDSTARL